MVRLWGQCSLESRFHRTRSSLAETSRRRRNARQSGILAAAGIFALENNVSKLADDHRRAKEIHESDFGVTEVASARTETNIVMVRTEGDAQQWIDGLEKSNVHAFALDPKRMRFVFHLDVDDAGLAQAIQTFRSLAVEFS
ncbi:MAG: hypothetical protein R2688_10425 [Fimbriimonadaceae bacterium]